MATREDIITRVQTNLQAEGTEASKKECGIALDAVLQAVAETAMAEGSVRTSIGTFRAKHTEARTGRNPKTGEPVEIPEKTTLAFKASKAQATVAEAPAPKKVAAKKAVAAPAAPAKKAPVALKKVVKR